MTTATGVVLAGGRSSRMGRDKALLPWSSGGTMGERVATALATVCDEVLVAGATDALPHLEHVSDAVADAGPLGGIDAILARGTVGTYLFCPCDVPLVTADLLRALLAPADGALVVLHVAGEPAPRPLPARFDASLHGLVREQLDQGRRAVHRLLGLVAATVVDVPASAADRLVNVNTPDEYRGLSARS